MRHHISHATPLTRFPADVVAVTGYAVVATATLAVAQPGAALRVALGLPLLVFAPGYVLVAALFPADGGRGAPGSAGRAGGARLGAVGGVAPGERLALSVGASLALLSVLAVALSAVPGGYAESTVLGTVAGFTVLVGALAGARRLRVPPEERFSVPYSRWLSAAHAGLVGADSRADAALNVALAAGVVVALGAVGFGVASPVDGEAYTGFAVLTENESGDLVAAGYPAELTAGATLGLTVAVENHEGRETAYTLVVELQRVNVDDGAVTVVETQELDRHGVVLGPGERWQQRRQLRPTMVGEELRLALYLYRGEAPADPGPDSAYRRLHLWVDVATEGANATSAARAGPDAVGTRPAALPGRPTVPGADR